MSNPPSASPFYLPSSKEAPASPVNARPKLPTTKPTSQRLPPPSLFQGPPSRNGSRVSLTLPGSLPTPQSASSKPSPQTPLQQPRPSRIPPASSFSASPALSRSRDQNAPNSVTQVERDRTDALWAEMQNTLAEVELSALNSSHVFGAAHSGALEDLRASQLALARAWAKSESDEMAENDHDIEGAGSISTMRDGPLAVGSTSPNSVKKGKDGDKDRDKENKRDAKGTDSRKPPSLEEETERDIQLARRRREANDRYFQQVNRGVLDVVSQLEEVARAMRRVEKESRDIWSDSSGEEGRGSATATESETEGTVLTGSGSPEGQRKG